MSSTPRAASGIPPPRRWLGLAFVGVWLYLISQLLRIFPDTTATAVDLAIPEARRVLAITAGLGQMILFAGLVAALWRANLAAGSSGAAIRGLAFGAAGLGILGFFEAALILDWFGFVPTRVEAFVGTSLLDAGILGGTALVFAGLAFLGLGLSQALRLFGRADREVSPSAVRAEETT